MELRLNLVLLAVLGTVWLGLQPSTPKPVLADGTSPELAALEDAFAQDPGRPETLTRLADAYLSAQMPALAVTVLRSAEPTLLEEPRVAHRLARAYEDSGRLIDALATADLALARCGRAVGTTNAQSPTPKFDCSERTYAMLDMHKNALAFMARWGIVDPTVDPRAFRAYQQAMLRARVAISTDPQVPTMVR